MAGRKPWRRAAQVLQHIAGRAPGVGKTRLMKLAYLADLQWRKLTGEQLTDFSYVLYKHGPFDPDLYGILRSMRQAGALAVEEVQGPEGTIETYQAGERPFEEHFAPDQLDILDAVIKEYSREPLKALLEETVYQTEPMLKASGEGEPLPMESVDFQVRDQLSRVNNELALEGAYLRLGNGEQE